MSIPSELEGVTESTAFDKSGSVWFKNSDGTWENFEDLKVRSELSTDSYVRSLFPGALENPNDAIQIRVVNGRLRWIKSDKPEEEWQELTPTLAKRIEEGIPFDRSFGPITSTPIDTPKEPEHKVGWYQDEKGNLYQYLGSEWVGQIPNKNDIDKLEFLG